MKNLTVVITNSGRPKFLWKAFKSCLAAGVQNITIASAPKDKEVAAVLDRICKAHPKTRTLVIDEDPGCNEVWMQGVLYTDTEWVHILHDDDLLLPAYKKAGLESILSDPNLGFVLCDSASHYADQPGCKFIHEHTDIWASTPGMFSCASLRKRLLESDFSISPVSGIFRKSHLVSVLEEFHKKLARKPEFHYRPKMEVGNDLLIWLRATQLPGYFYYAKEALVSYGSHGGSTTCSDLAGPKKLPAIYKRLKDYWRKTLPRKPDSVEGAHVGAARIATFCYVPDIERANKFVKHLNLFRRSFPFHFLSDKPSPSAIEIPNIGPFQVRHGVQPSDQYAFIAFLHTICKAKKMGLDYFILAESDCRFTVHHWDLQMWKEFSGWSRPGALFGGTPVCWHPWQQGESKARAIIEYAYRYQKESGVAMAFEGAHSGPWGTAIYPNGALAIYNVEACLLCFENAMYCLNKTVEEQSQCAAEHHAFDLHIGRWLVRRYGVHGALNRLAFLPSVYSGCKDHHVTFEQRMRMINSGKKIAVHQVKT